MIIKCRFSKYSIKTKICLIIWLCIISLIIIFGLFIFIKTSNSLFVSLRSIDLYRSRLKGIKYVLLWSDDWYTPISAAERRYNRKKCNCSVSNCVFTYKRNLLGSYTQFDAILFTDEHLTNKLDRPKKRSKEQIFVFTTIESPVMYPACEVYNDEYYNWTFTPRLDSDVVWNYFIVRNSTGSIVAPSKNIKWQIEKQPIDENITKNFKGRTKAAVWIVSNCDAFSMRDKYLTKLQEHLFHYGLNLDVFGSCNNKFCDKKNCYEMIKDKYYFYMAFENSFAEDYVTEKVLHGYNNFVVPVVYGGANYSRFLPPGSYIDARMHHPYKLAKLIYEAVNDPQIYLSYFYWTNFYKIEWKKYSDYDYLCKFCAALNSEKAKNAPVIKDFRLWWNGVNGNKWCLPEEYWQEMFKLNWDIEQVYGDRLYQK